MQTMTYDDFLNEWDDEDISEITAHTSGSTGIPKQIHLSRKLLIESARRTVKFFSLNKESKLHSCISPDFIGGKMMAVRARICNAEFSWEEPSNRPELSQTYDLVSVVPSQMWHILTLPNAKSSRFLIGGSAIPKPLRDKIVEKGLDCWESYGMTETASHIALRKVVSEPGPFHPLPGIDIYYGNEQNLCISLGGDYPAISTNDIVKIFPDGGFDVLGRTDNVIISGGLKIIPEDVEKRLQKSLSKLGISVFMISDIDDNKWGKRLELIIETNENMAHVTEAEIIKITKEVLQRHEIPKKVTFVNKIPTTANGKLRRNY